MSAFRVITAGPHEWVVIRVRDGAEMCSGSVVACARWVAVWGPIHR